MNHLAMMKGKMRSENEELQEKVTKDNPQGLD